MKFGEITDHLGNRGYATRASWNGHMVVCFGMDNSFWEYYGDRRKKGYYQPALADIKANDWLIIPFWWDGSQYDFMPYNCGKESYKWLSFVNSNNVNIIVSEEKLDLHSEMMTKGLSC